MTTRKDLNVYIRHRLGVPDDAPRTQTTDRHGKPIKNYRYAKHMFKVSVSGTATCQCCGGEVEFTAVSEVEPASAFESLVD